MSSICSQGETDKEKISFIEEVQMMMFGLGDSPKPLHSTAAVVEKVVLQQLIMIIGQAEEVAERREADGIFPQDILFLMRKDRHKLNRIINYIGFKEKKKKPTSVQNEGDMPGLDDDQILSTAEPDQVESKLKRKQMCLQFLLSIGIDLKELNSVDQVKQERLRRSDLRVQNMSDRAFKEYNNSRRATFMGTRITSSKFIDWLEQNCPECPTQKLKMFTEDMLLYLAKETVAQIIDIALLLRQDARVVPSDPFSRAHQTSLPFQTFGSSNRQLEEPPPVTPDEVREVLRRFYSTQLCPWGAFTRVLDPAIFNKIIAC